MSLRTITADDPLVLVPQHSTNLRVILNTASPAVILDSVGRTEELGVGVLATAAIPTGGKLTISPKPGIRSALVYIRALSSEAAAASAPVPKASPAAQYEQSLSLGGAVLTTRTDRDTTQPSQRGHG